MIPGRCAGTPLFHFSLGSGLCGFKKLPPPPQSLPGNAADFPVRSSWRRKQRHGRESGAAQTAHSAAGVLAAPQLEALSCRLAPGVGRAVSVTPGDAPFFLRQCRQKPVLLPRVWPRRRPDPLRPTLLRSAVPPDSGASPTGTDARSRFPAAGANPRLLLVPTPPPSGSDPISGAARLARSRPERAAGQR